MKKAEFANNVDSDEVAHYEPPNLDLNFLPSRRGLDKREYLMIIFVISHQNHMLWPLFDSSDEGP